MSESPGRYRFIASQEILDKLSGRRELRSHAADFLLTGGLLAGYSDGDFSKEEYDCLTQAMLPLFDDPKKAIAEFISPKAAIATLKLSMNWLNENGGDKRVFLYQHMAEIVAVDGVISPGERGFMQNVAKGLGIESDAAIKIINQALPNSKQQNEIKRSQ